MARPLRGLILWAHTLIETWNPSSKLKVYSNGSNIYYWFILRAQGMISHVGTLFSLGTLSHLGNIFPLGTLSLIGTLYTLGTLSFFGLSSTRDFHALRDSLLIRDFLLLRESLPLGTPSPLGTFSPWQYSPLPGPKIALRISSSTRASY